MTDPETDEQRTDRLETERDHAAGDHTYCGVTREATYPTEHLRNFILAKGYPGTAGALDELLRRAAAGRPAADRSRVLIDAADDLDRYVGLQSSDAASEVEGARLVIRELRRLAKQCGHTNPEGGERCSRNLHRLGFHSRGSGDTRVIWPADIPAAGQPAPASVQPTAEERRERWEQEASSWYEVINPRNATTSIALVYSDGSLYLPEGPDALTEEEFAFASARGNVYRLIRVEAAMAVADEEQRSLRGEIEARRLELLSVNERHAEEVARPITTSAIYDAIVTFQATAQLASLKHAQMRQHLAEHLYAALAAPMPTAKEQTPGCVKDGVRYHCPTDDGPCGCSEASPARERGARCPSCEHTADIHDADGRCWFTVGSGVPDANLVCPCAPRRDKSDPAPDIFADLVARCPEHGNHTEAWPECRCDAARQAAQMLTETDPEVVAYRSHGGRTLRCLRHKPDDMDDFVPVTAEDLEDGGICTFLDCGADVLITEEN